MAKKFNLDKFSQASQNSTLAEATLKKIADNHKELIELNLISNRPTGDARSLNPNHIDQLVDSISVIGLITPLTVDRHYRLLAGAHRKAALERISTEQPKLFAELFGEGIPVRIMDVDSEVDIVDALQIEVEENTQRRNYTAAEIREAALKLKAAGYKSFKGRPPKGQKSINRELMDVFRLSRRHVSRILNTSNEESETYGTLFKNTNTFLNQVEKFNKKLSQEEGPEINKIQRDLKRLIKNLRLLKENIESSECG